MTKRRVLVVVALLAALAAIYEIVDRSRSSNETEESKSEKEEPRSEEARAVRARARSQELRAAPRSVLAGVVLDADTRAPIAGAVVSLGRTSLDLGAQLNPGAAKSLSMSVTGGDGRFRLDGLRAGELSVTASAPGYLPMSRDAIQLRTSEENTAIELLMSRGGVELSGTVRDVGGGPIAGAYVRAQRISEGTVATIFRAPVTAITDGEGRYALKLRGGNYLIQAGHADYISAQRDTQLIGTSRTEDFELVPGAVIEGRVLVRGTDEPVDGAMVVQAPPRGGRITGLVIGPGAKTGPDGRFVLTGLRSGEIKLLAVARNYASQSPTTVIVSIAEHKTETILYVDAAYRISGFVVDAEDNSKGLGRVLVAAYNFGKRSAAVTSDPSAEDGYFEINGVVPGAYTLGAVTEGRLPEMIGRSLEIVDKDIDGVVVELSQGLSIRGRVDPPVAAYVRLEVDQESMGFSGIPRIIASQLARTTADEDGRFELPGLTAGKVTVVAEHVEHGAGRVPVDVTSPGLTDVTVKLETTGSISGRVVDEVGKPVARARVRASGGESRTFGFGSSFGDANRTITNDDGSFIVRGLGPSTYNLRVRRDGESLRWAGASLAEAGEPGSSIKVKLDDGQEKTGLNLVVESAAEKIRGRVVGTDGEPVADAWVKVGTIGSDPRTVRRRSDGAQITIEEDKEEDEPDDPLFTRYKPRLSDPDGYFVFEGLRAGEFWVSATGPKGDMTGTVQPVKSGANITVRLKVLGSATGTVTSGGEPLTSYTLKLNGPRLVRLPVTSNSGSFKVERLPAGRYDFHVQADAGRARKSVVIKGAAVEVNFEIEAYSEVTGVVIGVKSGKPLPGMAVIALSDGADTDSFGEKMLTGDVPKTGDHGRFVVSRQGFGEATIFIFNPLTGGFTPLGETKVALKRGESIDAGTIYAIDAVAVPENLRGSFGSETTVAAFDARPAPGENDSVPAGGTATDKFLWVSEVSAGGPAALAGIKVGDRIKMIDAIDISVVGAVLGQRLLGPTYNGVGATHALSIERQGTPVAIEVSAGPATP